MAGCHHPQALHPWLPARAPNCHPHPPRLLRPPPPHPATRLSCVGPSQRAGAAATGRSASLPMAWASCARPAATPSTKQSSATSSTSRAAAPMARDATSSTTPARIWRPRATPICCARVLASRACPLAADRHLHPWASQAPPCRPVPSLLPAPPHLHLGTSHCHPLLSLLPLGPPWPEGTPPQPVAPPAGGLPLVACGGPWVAWLGAPLRTPWDLIPTTMPAVAAAWGVPTHLSSRLGFLGHLSHLRPPGASPSSIESRFLSDKCLPGTDQLDLKGAISLSLWAPQGPWGCGELGDSGSFPPSTSKCINSLP